jgi:hypothetical protein
MTLFWLLSLATSSCFAFWCTISVILPSHSAGHVVQLTSANFSSVIDGSNHALIEFYAPWQVTPEHSVIVGRNVVCCELKHVPGVLTANAFYRSMTEWGLLSTPPQQR